MPIFLFFEGCLYSMWSTFWIWPTKCVTIWSRYGL